MQQGRPAGRIVRFGSFEADFQEGKLTKAGVRIHLQEQPLQILALLLERPGQIVTREEIRQKLWSRDTFVEFDDALNTAVRKLRAALNDSADNPRFLETVPRRGYRFIAPVASTPEVQAAPPIVAPVKHRISRRRYFWPAVALIVAAAAVGGYRAIHRPAFQITARDTIVLGDFSNSTGDAVFDDTLKTALNVSLRQSPFLNVLSDSEVGKALQLMTRPASTKLTPEVAREVCQRAGSKAYLAGAIGTLGSEYVLGLKAVNCQSGDTLAEDQRTAASKEKVLDALGEAASRLRAELGESLATVQKFDIPLEQATTSSLEALRALSLGRRASDDKGPAAALPYDQRAIALDPDFAMAYRAVGIDYATLSELGRASEYFTKAFQLREHASERERLTISADYYSYATGELDKAAQTFREEMEIYPREDAAYVNLGLVYAALGQYDKATEMTTRVARRAPEAVSEYENLANYSLALQRYDETRQVIHEAQLRNVDDFILHNASYALAFVGTDPAAMAEQDRWFAGKTEFENVGLALQSDTESYAGHLRKARELTERAVNSAVRADNKENAAVYLAIAAQREAAFGNATQARHTVVGTLKLAPASQGAESESALALAMAGDTTRAESLAQDLSKRFPLDTQVQALWLPAVEAQVALDKKKPADALNILQAASAVELGQIPFVNNISCLYPVYVRGEAYLAAGQASAAAAEFEKILAHSGIVWNCWTGTLAHLGAARAHRGRERMPISPTRGRLPPTKISSPSGIPPTPTSQSCKKPRRSTPSCNS
jgi:DNA-binding winged helix-turn-helix (wHTH) protein/tetratricopeptide (TPR) repeat protein